MKLERLYLPATVVWAVGLFIGSVLPATTRLAQELEVLNFKGFGLHLASYAVFGMLLVLTLENYRFKNYYFYSVLIAVVYGVLLELVQVVVPARDPSAIDALADTIGAFITATAYAFRNKKWS
ncbi:MAG: VanZ family protein [Nanoarchaeota archaeon]